MLRLWLAMTLLGGAPVAAAPAGPTPAEVSEWSAADYNNHLVSVEYAGVRELQARWDAVRGSDDPAVILEFLRQAQIEAVEVVARVVAFPPHEGDTTLRDAVAESWKGAEAMFREDAPAFLKLAASEDPTNETLAGLEALTRKMDSDADRIDGAVRAVQADFARRHGYQIVSTEEREAPIFDAGPVFTAPGIPPEGSVLSGNLHVNLATGYHNARLVTQNDVMDAWNAFMDATHGEPDGLERARRDGIARLEELREAAQAQGDWQGDASLVEANLALADTVLGQLTGPFELYCKKLKKGLRKQADVDLVNDIGDGAATAINEALARYDGALDGFRSRWGLDADAAWSQAQAAGAAPKKDDQLGGDASPGE